MASDDKVIIGQTHGDDDPEAVLIGYLMAVEALRKDKQALMWLTKNGVHLATEGYAAAVVVEGAPSIGDLHEEFIQRGGMFYACPVCLKTHDLVDTPLIDGAEAKGAPSVYEFAEGGALTFSY
jgi:predicted peroxiredoxin